MNNGLENCSITVGNKKLRYGYTTGSCAAAAAKAATMMLLMKKPIHCVELMTPKGILLHLQVEDIQREEDSVSCAIKKDGGDDPDATHGILIYARVCQKETPGIALLGGVGVGRVTRKGLEQPVGAAAINRVPRKMISEEVRNICEEQEYSGGLQVEILIPQGVQLAGKTFNPRLGIEGGLSILGTSGIVEPMSEAALLASIRLEMGMLRAEGLEYLLITPGNYGENFSREHLTLDISRSMKCSNYIGETLDMAVELGIKGILFVAHIGKFIKVSGGIMNTHSNQADARAELMAAHSVRAGAKLSLVRKLLATVTTEEAIALLQAEALVEPVMERISESVHTYLQRRCGKALQTEAILFSSHYGYLGETGGAAKLAEKFQKGGEPL